MQPVPEDRIFPQFQNGRVININECPAERFPLFENNEANDMFVHDALKGIQDCSVLQRTYFSKQNVQLVQDMIRYNVWIKSNKKYIIGNQSTIELEIIMRSIYLQHARNLNFKIKEQVKELNNILVHQVTPRIISAVEQYHGYLYRTENLYMPIEHPINVNTKGTRLLRSVTSTF